MVQGESEAAYCKHLCPLLDYLPYDVTCPASVSGTSQRHAISYRDVQPSQYPSSNPYGPPILTNMQRISFIFLDILLTHNVLTIEPYVADVDLVE